MGLRENLLEDIKTAMKAKEDIRLQTLRQLNSAIKNREIELRPDPITEPEILNVIKKAIKQRREAIDMYSSGDRPDLVEKETQELKVLEGYMPPGLSDDELAAVVMAVIAETGATSLKDMKLVMPKVIEKTQGAADNKKVSELIKQKLS